ncbi:MAG TPA: hypothetical protein ENL19_01980 [candidate division WOR-3 bacterium]|uniref:Uncharacterized protein n=1 Tax=candidate division WOR-3 bacterium TaxID=2052148 RepID=A0A7C5HFU1_UNCW3|nr:hypothetical protein [candidate division WOR-3 bacterium]
MLISQSDMLSGDTGSMLVQYKEEEKDTFKDSVERRLKASEKLDTKNARKTAISRRVGVAFSVSLIILVFLIVAVVWIRRWYYVYYR